VQQYKRHGFGYGPSIYSPSSLPQGTQGIPYFFLFASNGGQPLYTYTLVTGTLDAGLSFSSAGVISGTPANVETDTLGVRVTDSMGLKGNVQFFVLAVVAGVQPLHPSFDSTLAEFDSTVYTWDMA